MNEDNILVFGNKEAESDDFIQVAVGYGEHIPTFMVGDYVSGSCDLEDSDVIIAVLRDVSDAIEQAVRDSRH